MYGGQRMKLGFFFGAGAEVGYGLPIGGKFAIDLFRQDVSEHKQALRDQLRSLNQYDTYVTSWLPEKYATQRIHAFGKNEFTSLIESSIEYRKSEIVRRCMRRSKPDTYSGIIRTHIPF